MKIVVINSSGRTKGNTQRLLKVLENELVIMAERQHISINIKQVMLSELDIKSCRGCRSCFVRGDCQLKDAVAEIEALISHCDALVLASPVYMEDVNGIMKTWIDRMAFHAHRPSFYDKYSIAISTSGAGASKHSLITMRNALMAWGFHNLGTYKFRMGADMKSELVEEKYETKLSDIAKNLINAILNNEVQKPSLYSLVSFKIQQKYYKISDRACALDRTYWEEKGWLNSDASFYQPIKCNPVKRLTASVIGAILSGLFI